MIEKLRIDKYLWAIRIFKSRTAATDAIESGKVRLRDNSTLKPGRSVSVGDVYHVKTEAKNWTIEVTGFPDRRGAFREAQHFYRDLTTVEENKMQKHASAFLESSGKRQSKQGRPTKRNRRNLGRIMGV